MAVNDRAEAGEIPLTSAVKKGHAQLVFSLINTVMKVEVVVLALHHREVDVCVRDIDPAHHIAV